MGAPTGLPVSAVLRQDRLQLAVKIRRLVAKNHQARADRMTPSPPSGTLTAVLPCNDLDISERFYSRLGFTRVVREQVAPGEADAYRILANGNGGFLHLTAAAEGWLVPGKNPFGLYLYTEDVDALAAAFGATVLEKNGPEDKPWGMYEFALSDPDQTLVRVGWPTRLRGRG
jgi:catechol 2,3-dioxygenase-like lactoylglutathione lyase family enzyme